MDLQQAAYVLAICEERSFTRAAKRCGVTQPSLTNAISKLETDLGTALFVRPNREQRETLPTQFTLLIVPHLKQALAHIASVGEIAVKCRSVRL